MLIKIKNKLKFENNKGFTLLEVSFVMLVITIIMASVLNFITFGSVLTVEEKEKHAEKEDINTISKLLFDDLYYLKSLHIENTDQSDVLMYETSDGELAGYRFKKDGLYEIIEGKEKYVAKGQKIYEDKDSVYIEKGLVVFNFYFKDANIMWDFSFRPRVYEVSKDE